MTTQLPIEDVIDDVISALKTTGRVVLQAPPGAGKTTRVPLAILQAGLGAGKILVLEPRRLAARAAASRMAQTLGEEVGQTVGYRIRGKSAVGPNTKIEVITEGILTRMLMADPELPGVSVILFDEFHERALAADLGLALSWEVRQTLRDDLMIGVMSATLDASPVAALLDDAPIVTSQGRAYPVTITHLPRPAPKDLRFEAQAAQLVLQAAAETQGGILVFLPGEGEIRKVQKALDGKLKGNCIVRPLMGALPFAEQQRAIQPEENPQSRKIVLATAIAETSLTIQDIRVVIDCGAARRARYDPNTGLSRLVTEKVSRAEATQRTGRAGRVAEGTCYRMWAKAEEGALPAFAPAEIEVADLAPFALDLAAWGTALDELALLTPPPAGQWAVANALLEMLGAIKDGRLTAYGKQMARLPVHPRLSHMMLTAGRDAAPIAALIGEGSRLRTQTADLTPVLKAITSGRPHPAVTKDIGAQIKSQSQRLQKLSQHKSDFTAAQSLALAFPDRIAQRRNGTQPRYLLSGGMGAELPADDPLANTPYLIAIDLWKNTKSSSKDPSIRKALPLPQSELREVFADQIEVFETCEWSKRDKQVVARQGEKLGALQLTSHKWANPDPDAVIAAMLVGVAQLGLRPSAKLQRLQARAETAREVDGTLPDISTDALMDCTQDWLAPYLTGITTEGDWKGFDPIPAVEAYLGWDGMERINAIVPRHFTTPLGRNIEIDYSGDAPAISLRIQELFGQTTHPMVGKTPLTVTLLSPAQRPIQVTRDIPGFWQGSYADVRKDMRAQYPKHPWPDDPTQADPTLRAKPRKRS